MKQLSRRAAIAATLLLVWHAACAEINVLFLPQAGELVDSGPVRVDVWPDRGTLDCSPPAVQIDPVIIVSVRKSAVDRSEPCPDRSLISIGTLSAGSHRVTTRVYEADGITYAERSDLLQVMPLEGRCNRDPAISPQGLIVEAKPSAGDVPTRIASDAAYAAQLDNPTVSGASPWNRRNLLFGYPPLYDLTVAAAHVYASADFALVEQNHRTCPGLPPPDSIHRVVEFYNAALDHYFYTPDAGEIAAIEAGSVGPGWQRTGEGFNAVIWPGCPFQVDTPVYRFAGIPGRGPSSHFFTRDRAECYVVDKAGQWSFEGLPFWAAPVSAEGTCTSALLPLLRLWRPFGNSNHRFTTNPAIAAEMVAKGWVNEGPAMCVRGTSQ